VNVVAVIGAAGAGGGGGDGGGEGDGVGVGVGVGVGAGPAMGGASLLLLPPHEAPDEAPARASSQLSVVRRVGCGGSCMVDFR